MPEKSPFEKLQETVAGVVRGVAADPASAAGKAAGQVRGLVSLGLTVVGQVAQTVAERLSHDAAPPPSAPSRPVAPSGRPEAPTPADVAKVVEMKPKPPAKKAPPKKAPAKKATPSAKLPAKKAAEKAAEKKAPPVKKTAAKKAPAKKAPAKEAPATKTAAEVVEDTSVTTPVGTTGADVATNPNTTDTDLQQPGTAPLMDPATTKAVASEARTGARAADPEKG
ncbi:MULTISPECIES: hypothetical protein [unclassified Nocardioides]|uniref:hypothetical protein n=1 Tax=unclassified Nocardioides TaxID=2615069 RepID=UPI003623C472